MDVTSRIDRSYIPAAALVLLVFLAYLPAVSGAFVFDDASNIETNDTFNSVRGLGRIWFEVGATPQYYPLYYTSLWLQHAAWGLNTTGYHLVSLLMHAVAAILLWRVLRQLMAPWAWVGAMVFALHPVNAESVAWITEQKNLLSMCLALGAMDLYLRYAQPAPGQTDGHAYRRKAYAWSLTLFALALLTKTIVCTLPAVLLLLLWWRRGRVTWRDAAALLPFFALGISLGLFTAWVEKQYAGATGELFDWTLLQSVLIAGRAIWFYAGKLLLPIDLAFIYPRWVVRVDEFTAWLWVAGAATVPALLWLLRHKVGRGPLTAALIFGGVMFPALGFFHIYFMRYSFVADHFLYHASPAFIVLIVAVMASLSSRANVERWFKPAATLVLAAVLFTLTRQQAVAYQDEWSLWTHTLQSNPQAWVAHNNLGILHQARGEYDVAQQHYEQALAIHPDIAETYNNLANIAALQGAFEEARLLYEKALSIDRHYLEAQLNYGQLLASQGQYVRAVEWFDRVLQQRPRHPEAMYNKAAALESLGQIDQAISLYQRAISLRPRFLQAHSNLGRLLLSQRKVEDALGHFAIALRLAPDDPQVHYNVGNAMAAVGRFDKAIEHYRFSLKKNPNDAAVHSNLGNALAATGQLEQATEHYGLALKLRPDDVGARYNLALALSMMNRLDEAAARLNEILSLDPDHLGALNLLARVLATHPDPARRRVDQAIVHAERMLELTARRNPLLLQTLSITYAAAGRLDDAIAANREAITIAQQAGATDLMGQLQRELAAYERQRRGSSTP